MVKTRKRNYSPDGSDERVDRREPSSVQLGADPDAKSTGVQEPHPSAEDHLPTVDNTRKRSHSSIGLDERSDRRASSSVQIGAYTDTRSAIVQEPCPSAENHLSTWDNTRKHSHFPDSSYELGDTRVSSSLETRAYQNTQSASVQEPRVSAEYQSPAVDSSRKRSYSLDSSDARGDRKVSYSVQIGADSADTQPARIQEPRHSSEDPLPNVDNTHKCSHSTNCSDERGDRRVSSSVETGTHLDTQFTSVQEPRPSAKDHLPTVDNSRKRSHSPDSSEERGDPVQSSSASSVQSGSVPDPESASVQEPGPSAEDQPPAEDNPTTVSCALCLDTTVRKGHFKGLRRCPHAFHQSCIDKWLNNNRSCPLCRTLIPRRHKRRPRRSRRPQVQTRF